MAEASPYGVATAERSPSAEELRRQLEMQRNSLGRDLNVLGDKVSPGRMVERRRAAVRQSARGFKDRIMGAADSATSRIGDTAGSIGDAAGHAPQAAKQAAQGNPLAVGLVAFGAGAVLASLLPTTEKERRFGQQTATPALERAAEEAGSVAQQAAEDLKPIAQDAAESVKSSAQDAANQVKQST
jgi:hypothetical protein